MKEKNERFTAALARCRQNLKYENLTSSFSGLLPKIAPKSVPHDNYLSSFNQSNHWFVALTLLLPSSVKGKGPYFTRVARDSATRLINLWPLVLTPYPPSSVNAPFTGIQSYSLVVSITGLVRCLQPKRVV